MLAHDDGTFLSPLTILGNEDDTLSKDLGINIEHHLVAFPLGLIIDLATSRLSRFGRRGQLADDLLPKLLAKRLAGFLILLQRGGIELRPERFLTAVFGLMEQGLGEGDELIELALFTN